MKTSTLTTVLAASASFAYAQLSFDQDTGEFSCGTTSEGDYCAGESLSTNIIVRCDAGKGTPGNCNDNLAGVPPVGVKSSALCWQSSDTAADAVCSFNGIGYPDSGESFSITSGSSSNSTSGSGNSTSNSNSSSSSTSTEESTATETEETSVPEATVVQNETYSISPVITTATGVPPTGAGFPTGTASLLPFPGAASQMRTSSFAALLPVAGLFAFLL